MRSHLKNLHQKCFRILLLILVATILSILAVNYNDIYKQAFKINGFSVVESANANSPYSEQSQPTPINKKILPRQAIVVVDPGHGGDEWGTFRDDIYEKKVNLDISLKLGKMLDENGIHVVYTRTTDKYLDLKGRAQIANDMDADLFVSVHNNHMPNNPDYKGTETLYCTPTNHNENSFDGEKFAKIVQNQLVKTLKTYDNGTIFRPNLSVLRRTKMPAVIVEVAYISNYEDRNNLAQDNFRIKAAQGLNKAVLESLRAMGAQLSNNGKFMFN